jgi:hypothetical protein
MRKIHNSTYISLDGVIENPQNWPPSEVEDETETTIQTELLMTGVVILTYTKESP